MFSGFNVFCSAARPLAGHWWTWTCCAYGWCCHCACVLVCCLLQMSKITISRVGCGECLSPSYSQGGLISPGIPRPLVEPGGALEVLGCFASSWSLRGGLCWACRAAGPQSWMSRRSMELNGWHWMAQGALLTTRQLWFAQTQNSIFCR